MSRSTSASVRYSRVRRSPFRRRLGVTVRFTAFDVTSLRCDLAIGFSLPGRRFVRILVFLRTVSIRRPELNTHKKATFSDLYLIHQQGTRGAEEHVNHPDRLAWQSMCATDERNEKGEKWCKRAIWENTLPEVKHVWKSVDNLTSGVFVRM